MAYTLAEKTFIAANRPIVRIEKVTFAPFYATTDDAPEPGNCFWTAAAADAAESGAEIAGLDVTLHFMDAGAVYDQKFIRFDGSFRVLDDVEYAADRHPEKTFEAIADACGRFTVSFPVLLCKSDELPRDYLEQFCTRQAFFVLTDFAVGNQFVSQNTQSVMGTIAPDGDKAVMPERITYDLAPDTESSVPDGFCNVIDVLPF